MTSHLVYKEPPLLGITNVVIQVNLAYTKLLQQRSPLRPFLITIHFPYLNKDTHSQNEVFFKRYYR